MRMKPQAPCKGCPDRDTVNGCHDRCEKYQQYKKDQLEYNTILLKIKKDNSYFDDRMAKCASRHKHKK